jgi:hypothetical protein
MILLLLAMFQRGSSAAGVADALLASDNDKPATPNAGTAFLLFRLEDRIGASLLADELAIYATAPWNVEQVTKKLGNWGVPRCYLFFKFGQTRRSR